MTALPRAGFRFTETMAGTWRPADGGPERPLSFTVTATVADVIDHLRDGRAALTGTLSAAGLATGAEAEGTLTIRPLERFIGYELAFVSDQGARCRLAGRKDLDLLDLLGSMTRLDATIEDDSGAELGRARIAFDVKSQLVPMLLSFRPRLSPAGGGPDAP